MHTATTQHEINAQVPSPAWEMSTDAECLRLARATCEELPGAWEASLDDPGDAPVPTTPSWRPARASEDIIPF